MFVLPDAAVDLAADVDRHLGLFFLVEPEQADPPAVERQQVLLVEPDAELEDVGALEEERALLREEDREARQVDLPDVDFGLGEVGVDGERGCRLGPSFCVTSRIGSASNSVSIPGPGFSGRPRIRPTAAGRMLSADSEVEAGRSARTPALLIW